MYSQWVYYKKQIFHTDGGLSINTNLLFSMFFQNGIHKILIWQKILLWIHSMIY